jgi:hypothetical protein
MSVFRRAAGATRSSMLGAWSCYIPISAFEVWIFSLMRIVCPSDNRYLSHGRHPLSGARCATTIKVRLIGINGVAVDQGMYDRQQGALTKFDQSCALNLSCAVSLLVGGSASGH